MMKIKSCGEWLEYQKYVEEQLNKLRDIDKIQGEVDLEAKKKAVKLIKDILYVVNN